MSPPSTPRTSPPRLVLQLLPIKSEMAVYDLWKLSQPSQLYNDHVTSSQLLLPNQMNEMNIRDQLLKDNYH